MDTKQIMAEYGIAPLPDDPVKPVLGYENGTMFRDLHKPFYGKACGGEQNG